MIFMKNYMLSQHSLKKNKNVFMQMSRQKVVSLPGQRLVSNSTSEDSVLPVPVTVSVNTVINIHDKVQKICIYIYSSIYTTETTK